MYLKRFRRRASGRDLTYLALAHNVWETRPDGRRQARPLLLMSLGPEDETYDMPTFALVGVPNSVERGFIRYVLAIIPSSTGSFRVRVNPKPVPYMDFIWNPDRVNQFRQVSGVSSASLEALVDVK